MRDSWDNMFEEVPASFEARMKETLSALEEKPKIRRFRFGTGALVAAALLVAVLGGTALATDFFGLKSLTVTDPNASPAAVSATAEPVSDSTVIALQGVPGSPEFKANAEWMDFLASYDTAAAAKETAACLPEKYDLYSVSTQDMANELDQITRKYNLRLHTSVTDFDSEDTLYMALKSGQVDMAYRYSGGVNPTVISDLSACDNLTLQPIRNTSNSAVLIFNNNKAPFDNENIRKAVACAIDYDAFRATFGSSYASASRAGFIPEGTPGYIETPELTRDLDKAKEYLTAAGCEDTDGDGFVEYNGEKLTFPVMLRGDKPAHERYAELLKNNLAQIGIELVPDIKEVATFRELTEQNQAQTAVITGLTAFGMAKNQGMASLYLWGENRMGYGQVYDEAYKALLDQADAAVTMEDYYAAAAAMQEYYAEHIPAVALYWDSHVQAYNSAYEGFVTDGTFGLLNVQTWMKLHKAA